MLTKENRYDFRRRLMELHRPDRRDYTLLPKQTQWEIPDGLCIVLSKNSEPVLLTAARDFVEYLRISMDISARITYKPTEAPAVYVDTDCRVEGPIGYEITVTPGRVQITGSDAAGAAQGLYALEDTMNRACAPFLPLATIARHALFDTRFVQSPFGMFEFPDEALAWMAHLGYNAIALWLKDSGTSLRGDTVNVSLLCDRAEKYGIKIYAMLYAPHNHHPDDEGSQEFYDKLYGDFLSACPKLGGIMLTGEANEFQSRDPRAGKTPYTANYEDNIPTGKIAPGWWPCNDYGKWVAMIRRSLDKVNPDTDIWFSTYNWGFAPEEDRVALIEAMPKRGVTIVPVWDMFQQFRVGDVIEDSCDYSLRNPEPGNFFVSEAKAAKRAGVRLGGNCQSSGRTWDFGVVPYEPMPFAWIERYEHMIKAHDEWGLVAVNECIHYGFHPSLISYLEKEAFYSNCAPLREFLKELLAMEYGANCVDSVTEGLKFFDDAIRIYIPTNEDQYGPFRIGPSYPLWLRDPRSLPNNGLVPYNNNPMFKGIYFTYAYQQINGRNSLPSIRWAEELKSIETMTELFAKGVAVLESIENPNEELERLILLGKFLYRSCITAANAKRFHRLKFKLTTCETREEATKLLDELEAIMLAERENAAATIPIVELDSRLGWEPSMEYTTDAQSLQWKLKQLDFELNFTMLSYRKSNALGTPEAEKYVNHFSVMN